jgi:bifunctional non-homologous end joining protein LigD
VIWREKPGAAQPMLATLADPPLTGKQLVYEPKYDGIRAIAEITPGRRTRAQSNVDGTAHLWSRLGNEKTSQFPSVVAELERFGTTAGRPLVIDGEIVALDKQGKPTGFQKLQGRIHLSGAKDVERIEREQPVAFIAFDLLRDGDDDVRGEPLTKRRERLERLLAPALSPTLRISERAINDGRALHERATAEGWEGLIVKEASSPYQSGRRSPAWRKLKLVHEQEFVIGGWTEPRQSRQHFGALLLGVFEKGQPALTYVGHTGTGFDHRELDKVAKLLKARALRQSPFSTPIKTNEPAHWVRPDLVAQVRFTEWTADRKLRHPVYLGLRDDKRARSVEIEDVPQNPHKTSTKGATHKDPLDPRGEFAAVVAQLQALEDARKDGVIALPDGSRLGITNPAKPFWPKLKLTKGDLLRYYATVATYLLPVVADRPLVMKRFPNGIDGMAFYQQKKVGEKPPPGVRLEQIEDGLDPMTEPGAKRFVGGSLTTLLYMTQLAAISQDPWFSRVQSPLDADYVALDLDPDDHTPFSRVLDVARWVRDELAALKVTAVPKTSGSSGLHIYIPLPPETSYESGQLFCQIIATVVAAKHPKVATVERKVKARPRGTVYVDFLQNILGKTLATAYSARASEFAGVSTPLTWAEVDQGVDPRDFTIVSGPARFREVGDLWARLRTGKPANLEAVFRKYGGS